MVKVYSPSERAWLISVDPENTFWGRRPPDGDWFSPKRAQRIAPEGCVLITKPQFDLLVRVNGDDEVRLNGRARKTVEALERAGLVEVEYDQEVHSSLGSGIEITEVFIVRRVG